MTAHFFVRGSLNAFSREGPAIIYNSSLALTYFVPKNGCQTKYVNISQLFPDAVKE